MITKTAIPKIIHRVVGETLDNMQQACWKSAILHNRDWQFMTHQDPVDPAEWPITSQYWSKCVHGAFVADLMRLEALWKYGGVYLDSDIYIVRPLDRFISYAPFACRFDKQFISNAVIGAPAQHPAIMELIEKSIEELEQGKIAFGPSVITDSWTKRDDVDLYHRGYFYYVVEGRAHIMFQYLDELLEMNHVIHGIDLHASSWKKKDENGNDPWYLKDLEKLWQD